MDVGLMAEIKAIQTWYAGCRFRSRLEARWAVFFSTLGIKWHYEPEGFATDAGPYLPDFWLPDWEVWVEVKGSEDQLDVVRLVSAARALPGADVHHPLCVLGPVPKVSMVGWPDGSHTTTHSGLAPLGNRVVQAHFWFDNRQLVVENMRQTVAGAHYINMRGRGSVWGALTGTGGVIFDELRDISQALDAYRAARSARFEHGESGLPR